MASFEFSVRFQEGEDLAAHWSDKLILPRAWQKSSCDRLLRYLVDVYNKARPDMPQLKSEACHLSNEADKPKSRCEALGSDNVIADVIASLDTVFIRPGSSIERTEWRCTALNMDVHVPISHEALLKLRAAVDANDTQAFQQVVEGAGIASPHEMLVSEVDVKDGDRVCGSEWHSVGGRFAWTSDLEGDGGDMGAKVTLAEYARRRSADRVIALIELADAAAAPLLASSRGRPAEDIESSAQGMAGKMTELNKQLEASLKDRAES